jgi:hypothetical protein
VDDTQEDPQDNLARLKSHLKKDSFAETLVLARPGTGAIDPRPALRKVLLDRIEELRHAHEPMPDQQA